jgi:hypothetical protein
MGESHGHPALFVVRVVRVGNRDRERVGEDGARLGEADPVPLPVATFLPWIPLEPDGHVPMKSSGGGRVKPNAAGQPRGPQARVGWSGVLGFL